MLAKIIAHGGAWNWADTEDTAKCAGLKEAVSLGYAILQQGGSALDAVEQTVIALENNPIFDAGTGGYLNQDGLVQLDALIVDGAAHNFGAVGGVTQVKNPITLARKIMEETEQCFIVGQGADHIAQTLGLPTIANEQLVTPAMKEFFLAQRTDGPSDTVGAVAIDNEGNVVAGTSTSGTPYKPAGRVGDSPLYGAGGYAENGIGAVGATGLGENIMRVLLSKYTCDKLAKGISANQAAKAAMQYIEHYFDSSMAGVILVDSQGQLGAAHTTPKLAIGWVDDTGTIHSAMQGDALYQI